MSKLICSSCTNDIELAESTLTVTCFACEKSFHGFSCIGLSKPQIKMIKEVKGVLWNCEQCSLSTFNKFVCHKLSEISNKQPVSGDQDAILNRLDQLSSEMETLKKNVDSLSTHDTDFQIGGKRSRTGHPRPLTPGVQGMRFDWSKPSTSSDSQAIQGTNADTSSLKAVEAPSCFHVSRFNPTTTEEELRSWIVDKIQLDDPSIKCSRLIPKGRDVTTLEFISFKVAIAKSLESKIMDPSVWPTNITVRPFQQLPFLKKNYATIPSIA